MCKNVWVIHLIIPTKRFELHGGNQEHKILVLLLVREPYYIA